MSNTYPASLALIDDDRDFSRYLTQYLRNKGITTEWYADSDDLLCSPRPYAFDFYVVDLMLPGIDGLSLLRLLRRATRAGILVVSGTLERAVFEKVISGGADMYLAKPVTFDQVLLGVEGVFRRSAPPSIAQPVWRLDAAQRLLLSPDGARIELSASDVEVLSSLLEAQGETVSREKLAERLGLREDADPNLLSASIYRLRRRIERATPLVAPLQSKSRVGYAFRAPLARV